jgi:hypothetical protein
MARGAARSSHTPPIRTLQQCSSAVTASYTGRLAEIILTTNSELIKYQTATELISGTFPETIWALQLELMNLRGLSEFHEMTEVLLLSVEYHTRCMTM